MADQKQILEYLTLNKDRFKEEYHITRIGLFGSIVRGEQSNISDIDIIVEFEENTPNLSDIKQEIKKEIINKFKRPVDICREKYIKQIFKNQILSEVLYA